MTIWRYPATYLYISTATAEILVVILIAKIQMARTYVPQLAAWQWYIHWTTCKYINKNRIQLILHPLHFLSIFNRPDLLASSFDIIHKPCAFSDFSCTLWTLSLIPSLLHMICMQPSKLSESKHLHGWDPMLQRRTGKHHMRNPLRHVLDLLLSGVAELFLPSRSKVRGAIPQVSKSAPHLPDAYSRLASTLPYLIIQTIQRCPPMVACA